MNDLAELRRVAIAGVALAVVVGVISTIAIFAAAGWDFEAALFADPARILAGDTDRAPLWRLAMLTDMFFSYLLLAPLALYGHRLLRERRPWLADLGLMGALGYILLGAGSAAILAIAGSSLIERHAMATGAEQAAIASQFELLRDIFYFGIWQTLDAITAGVWLFSFGLLLLADRQHLGRLLVVLGVAFWASGTMTMLGIHSIVVIAVIFIGALIAWLGWLVLIRRVRGQSAAGRPAG